MQAAGKASWNKETRNHVMFKSYFSPLSGPLNKDKMKLSIHDPYVIYTFDQITNRVAGLQSSVDTCRSNPPYIDVKA